MKAQGLSDQEILGVVQPLAEHTENAWNEKNYQEFIRYLIDEHPDQVFPESEFNRQLEESYDALGKHTLADLLPGCAPHCHRSRRSSADADVHVRECY